MKINFDDDQVWLSVPLSRETAERLAALADMCHADHVAVAASLLHDVLKEDEDTHFLETIPAAGTA